MPRLEEIAFDSERKLMSTKYRLHGVSTILTKGAVDVLLDRSVKLAESGGSREINDKIKEEILRQNQEFSENGLRVLAFAYKEVDEGEELTLDEENGFTFIGLVAMIDPPREEAAEAFGIWCAHYSRDDDCVFYGITEGCGNSGDDGICDPDAGEVVSRIYLPE